MYFDYRQIDDILNPRSLAIVGASGKPLKFGALFTASQLAFGFKGPVYLVNPGEKEILGHPVHPSLEDLPEPPDLVYITIPAHRSIEVLHQCARLRVKGVVIQAAGFREIGKRGLALEKEALRLAREGGFRIIGPNCFGIYNPRRGLTLLSGQDFSRREGDIAFISQSGGFSLHVGKLAMGQGLHFNAIVSYGNAADLNETHFLRYFSRHPRTRVIGGYLEGVKGGRDFLAAVEEASRRKDLVLWKVGKGAFSRRAVLTHTGSMTGSTEIWEGIVRRYGVIEVSCVEEMCDTFLGLRHLGRSPGKRILLAGGGGGLGTHACDLAEAEGLEVPPLQGESLDALEKLLDRDGAVASNPLDIGAPLIPLDRFREVMREASRNSSTDVTVFDLAVNFAYPLVGEEGLEKAVDILVQARRESGKPLAAVLYSRAVGEGELHYEKLLRHLRTRLLEGGVAVFPSMHRALATLRRVNIPRFRPL